MKKLLIGSLLTLGISAGLVSCASKAYDADPKTDYNGAVNPLDTSKYAVLIGSMQGQLNGSNLVFAPAYYTVDTAQVRHIYASVRYDSVYFRSFRITCIDSMVKGKSDYLLTQASVYYNVYDTVSKKMKEYRQEFPANSADTNLRISIVADKDKGMRGVINGFMYNKLPEPGNYNDVVYFKNMYFYFEERK